MYRGIFFDFGSNHRLWVPVRTTSPRQNRLKYFTFTSDKLLFFALHGRVLMTVKLVIISFTGNEFKYILFIVYTCCIRYKRDCSP